MAAISTTESIAPPGLFRRRRRRLVLVLLSAAALLGAAAGYVLHRDGEYGPLEPGSFGGFIASNSPVLGARHGGVEAYIKSTSPDATVPMMVSLDNNGSQAVTIESAQLTDIVTDVQWSTYTFVTGGYVSGVDTPWHPFPAIVPANGTLRLRVTVHRPASCRAHPITSAAGIYTTGGVELTWKSLLHTHHTYIDSSSQLQIC